MVYLKKNKIGSLVLSFLVLLSVEAIANTDQKIIQETAVKALLKMPSHDGSNRELCIYEEANENNLYIVGVAGRYWNNGGTLYLGLFNNFPNNSWKGRLDSKVIILDYDVQKSRSVGVIPNTSTPIYATEGIAYGNHALICVYESNPVYE